MIELIAFALSLTILICFFVLCANTASMKKEMVKQNKLQTAILRKLESWNDPNAVSTRSSVLPFYLFIYDSKDRKFLVMNSNSSGYEALPGTSEHAMALTVNKSQHELEIIRQDEGTNEIKYVKLQLKPVVDNLIDIADHLE